MPLTTDHPAAKMYLQSATTDVVPTQGTVIGDALKMCYAAFNTKEKKYKAVLLISDGEDHDESAIKTTKALADEGVMVNTVGIGSPEGTTIIDPATHETKKDAAGAPVSFVEIDSPYGHDSFLLEVPAFDDVMRGFITSVVREAGL